MQLTLTETEKLHLASTWSTFLAHGDPRSTSPAQLESRTRAIRIDRTLSIHIISTLALSQLQHGVSLLSQPHSQCHSALPVCDSESEAVRVDKCHAVT